MGIGDNKDKDNNKEIKKTSNKNINSQDKYSKENINNYDKTKDNKYLEFKVMSNIYILS